MHHSHQMFIFHRKSDGGVTIFIFFIAFTEFDLGLFYDLDHRQFLHAGKPDVPLFKF